ncbi:MAG TPA: amino acid racemase [Elusimicrobiales bacterium]|nr:amino acid racemase [Elusimicrobiales bacterium]
MKKLGLVGGIGPESTLEYYKLITEGYRAAAGGMNYPRIIIDSLNLGEMYTLVEEKRWPEFAGHFVDSVNRLAAGGAEFAAMAANTAHIVFDEVSRRSPLPLISIVEETCRFSLEKGYKRVVVLGTGFTMSSGLYADAFARRGMEAFVPAEEEQKVVHGVIFPHLQEGIVVPEEKRAVLGIAERLLTAKKADALVLGCTELPLLIKEGDLPVPLLDTTRIHVDAILARLRED